MSLHPFACFLREALTARSWSQADLLRALEEEGVSVSESAVSLWCGGKAIPDPRRLPRLFAALRLDTESELRGYRAASGLSADLSPAGEVA